MVTSDKRLIEVAFPLKQVSLDSVHEKNVRHGHISTLHIWPARRPLAAARAALIATLLPDPGDDLERKDILERMAGRVTEKIQRTRINGRLVERVKEETTGGILHWGRENGPDLDWFRKAIRDAYGGRAPKVLDPFAGGGAIPLEAMRLGCEVTAMDINPVAWFILKCTLEYPQRLAGQTRPLPDFALQDREFMESFLKAKGFKGISLRDALARFGHGDGYDQRFEALASDDPVSQADLAWHVRAWGRWVLARARRDLASCYPTYAEFESPSPNGMVEKPPMRLLEIDEDGIPVIDPLNARFDLAYLKDRSNPRWIAKPTVAYLWARTVTCKQCRATLPLLKTRWLCKKEEKRVLLTMEQNEHGTGVVFGVAVEVPRNGGNAAQRREHDRRIGAGTMSRTGAACPCCGQIMTMEDIRLEGRSGRLGAVMTAVVVDGPRGKEYRLPTDLENNTADVPEERLLNLYANIPYGMPEEPTPKAGSGASRAFSVGGYGLTTWRSLFSNRQLLALGTFVRAFGDMRNQILGYPTDWAEALLAMSLPIISRMADRGSTLTTWTIDRETIRSTFARFALPITWDYSEFAPILDTSGGFIQSVDWVAKVCDHLQSSVPSSHVAVSRCGSAVGVLGQDIDVILTDPPYYDAIPYSDLMDFFYVWLRRSVQDLAPDVTSVFSDTLGPKWDHQSEDGELIDDASRFDGNRQRSREAYEQGMARSFQACNTALRQDGRLVVVFANKQPDAWETLVGALIRAGFVVDGSWPIQTEMGNRNRAIGSSALSSSVWLVCKKRPTTRPGWDNVVLREMREKIIHQLRNFWDAGIRGPDFVWAATGPALEAFSEHPVVRKANAPDQLMSVSEFLREVRRMVVDFVVGRVLSKGGEEVVASLDDITTYYLLHRNDFRMDEAPIGGCILYALSCNLSDSALTNQYDILAHARDRNLDEDLEEAESVNGEGGGGAKVRLKAWDRRRGKSLGMGVPGGRAAPLIDQVHKLMQLWRAGDQARVDNYLDMQGLQRNTLFHQLLQALIELSDAGSDERAILEAISNHSTAHGDVRAPRQGQLQMEGV